ncbi:hypothetical protein [Saccharomonospora sp. CUA-673]|uniref:hypothetical protein n=1 Tax=Saccharomonospora sp. CUA-673 TaxID=1904969 RepID=UPI0011150F46|nr:hypothetical protein [Saccharomonospora sp. CUA-673]
MIGVDSLCHVDQRWERAAIDIYATKGTVVRHRAQCRYVADQLADADVLPPWPVSGPSDGLALCAEYYWYRQVLEAPLVDTALDCGKWLTDHADEHTAAVLGRRWALGFGSALRATVDSDTDLDSAVGSYLATAPEQTSPAAAWFAVAFHATKLQANLHGLELASFLDHSRLALAASPHSTRSPLPALRTFAALRAGEYGAVRRARGYLSTTDDPDGDDTAIVLAGLMLVDARGDTLVHDAARAAARWATNALLHALHAEALASRDPRRALDAIDEAIRRLAREGRHDFAHRERRFHALRSFIDSCVRTGLHG